VFYIVLEKHYNYPKKIGWFPIAFWDGRMFVHDKEDAQKFTSYAEASKKSILGMKVGLGFNVRVLEQ